VIYDKPVTALMAEAVKALSADGRAFSMADVVGWFGQHFPRPANSLDTSLGHDAPRRSRP